MEDTTFVVKQAYKKLAAAVLTLAYFDIDKAERARQRTKVCNWTQKVNSQLFYWERDAKAFLRSENADFYRSFFQGD